ncbi:trace amine-associated receptor 4-like [Schistocerca gregaria]|uniref:trace amine-associated receptor 4-like n=1 Tax=Schistocerca gregaria TaxID=7010 RepID=UPI00211E01B6|nr:trace amine-associated receptor 4-like [Schistocerca gregaria]
MKETLRQLYAFSVPSLLLLCAASLAVNARVLLSAYWIRRPLSPTLHISLSLAAADGFASAVLAAGLTVNSLLARWQHDQCVLLLLEALRLAGVIITVAHLLALAANHYLGILRPLHYLTIMTHRNTAACIAALWLLPTFFFFAYFSFVPDQGFQSPECHYTFLRQYKFRAVFSSLFFGPLLLMLLIYSHIFVIVQRHQASRLRFSRMKYVQEWNCPQKKRSRQMARNVKAVYTTLLILGSYLVALMPAVLIFVLYCDDCLYPLPTRTNERINMFFIFTTVNFLVILKTLINPIIYAARMHEIKAATKRMNATVRGVCCQRAAGRREAESEAGGGAGSSSEATQLRQLSGSAGPSSFRMRSLRSPSRNGSLRASARRTSGLRHEQIGVAL